MSDEVAAAPVESAPSSTAEIASQVIESAEQEAASTPEPVEEARVEASPTEPPRTLSDVEQLLQDAGIMQEREPDGRWNRIPLPRVKEMIEKGLKKHQEAWTGEKTTLEKRVSEYEAHMREMGQDIEKGPEALLARLAEQIPAYREYMERLRQPTAQAAPVTAEMPQPDLPLADGTRTYSLEGVQKLLDWKAQQLEAKIEARLKPLTERDQREAQRQQQEQVQRAAREKAQSQMAEAQTWPHFGPVATDGKLTPFQQEVMDVYMKDKSLDLRAAYMKVFIPRVTEDDAKKRARWAEEVNKAPKSTAIPRGQADVPRRAGPASTADIAARVIAEAEARH